MLYSKSAKYAIQTMIFLAELDGNKPIMVSKIAEAYKIPPHFLAKIAQILVKNKLLKAVRGRNGGICLARPANKIFIYQIIEAINGPEASDIRCVIGLDLCSDKQPCPLHKQWWEIKDSIESMLENENLSNLTKKISEKREKMKNKKKSLLQEINITTGLL